MNCFVHSWMVLDWRNIIIMLSPLVSAIDFDGAITSEE